MLQILIQVDREDLAIHLDLEDLGFLLILVVLVHPCHLCVLPVLQTLEVHLCLGHLEAPKDLAIQGALVVQEVHYFLDVLVVQVVLVSF